jgi:hypothetical protein
MRRCDDSAVLSSIENRCVSGEKCYIVTSCHYTDAMHRPDGVANISPIEILWCLGKNCCIVASRHCVKNPPCCAQFWRSCKSLLHWNPMVFGQELLKRQNCSYYHWSLSIGTVHIIDPWVSIRRSLSIDPHARWVSIHMSIAHDMLCRVPTLVQKISPP